MESGKVTLDLIDMTAADAIVACDEGLVEQVEPDKWLAAAPDGTPASKDFFAGTLSVGGTNCFIPQIVPIPPPSVTAPMPSRVNSLPPWPMCST